jgi:hypothetical protein
MASSEFNFKMKVARQALNEGLCKAAFVRIQQAAETLGGLTQGGQRRSKTHERKLLRLQGEFSRKCVISRYT